MALIYFLSLLFFLLSTSCKSSSPTCYSNYSCGHINISYPFSLYNPHDDDTSQTANSISYCGYPDLQIYCENNDTPIIYLNSDNYTITDINYPKKTVSLLDTDILNSSPSCPEVQHNISLNHDFTWLNYTNSDVNLTFFFNCDPFPSSYNEISCLDSIFQKNSYVFQTADIIYSESYDEWVDQCDQVVVTPVFRDNLEPVQLNLSVEFGPVVKKGFELVWYVNSQSCSNCEKKDGQCGYNTTSNSSFVETCFCPKGGCRKKKKNKPIVIAGISAAAAFALVLLIICIVFLHVRRKRENSHSSKFLMHSRSARPPNDPLYKYSKDDELDVNTMHVFSYEELEEATEGFSAEIGDGGFGTVYKGKLHDGRVVAIKRLYEHNYRRMEQFINEVEILSLLRHPNLVTLYGSTSRHSRELLLVYEFISNGTLADHLHGSLADKRVLTWPIRLSVAIETANALTYLHAVEPQIIHRDVKTNNILLDSGCHVKVADFGLSRLFPVDATHVSTAPQGTPGYLDPEYHQCYQLTDKSDVYSFGVVLVELISSMPAVDVSRRRNEINLASMAVSKIQKGELEQLVDPWLGYGSDGSTRKMITMVAELAFRCLQQDGDMRPPVREVLEVLVGIEKEGLRKDKTNGEVVMEVETEDDKGLLNNINGLPLSPDSVAAKWISRNTTPNTSE